MAPFFPCALAFSASDVFSSRFPRPLGETDPVGHFPTDPTRVHLDRTGDHIHAGSTTPLPMGGGPFGCHTCPGERWEEQHGQVTHAPGGWPTDPSKVGRAWRPEMEGDVDWPK
eukprot:scaffold261_cov336-Pavlova_lutheri.AAC.15